LHIPDQMFSLTSLSSLALEKSPNIEGDRQNRHDQSYEGCGTHLSAPEVEVQLGCHTQ
jgi:hypothetical protein